jgi:[acyl-carrier-protein] S-malonyltransferase
MRYLLCPGQGSQKPGFLKPWIENESFASLIGQYSEITGLDLIQLGTEATAEEIAETSITQPLIVAASIASARTIFVDQISSHFDAVVGHSVGEFAAGALSGVLTDEQALTLVSARAQAMQKAAEEIETGMAAAIGQDLAELERSLGDLQIANYNGANQYVVAGTKTDLTAFIENPPAGFRIIPLSVSGAFHTSFMNPASESLQEIFESVKPNDPEITVFSNRDGRPVTTGEDFVASLLKQVSSPVRWDQCMESMQEQSKFAELAPSGVLSNLVKKTISNAEIYALKSPDESIDFRQ